MTGVALGDIHLRFTWQAWHLVTSTFVSRGRRGTYGTGRALVAHRVLSWRRGRRGSLRGRRGTWWHPPSLCVAGVAIGDIHLHFAWQAWHLATSTFVSRGRRGTLSHPHSFHVAGVALTALGGLWWRTGFSADAVDAAALCVAGVALGDIHLHFAWQAWHLRHFAWQAWQLVTSTFTLRGRRGTRWHPPSLCVAGVTLIDTYDAGLVRFKLSRRYLASCAIHVLFVSWLCWRLRLFDRGRGKLSCRLLCSICCMMLRTDTNGASGRLLTFLAVSLCVFKCSNIYCRFHGSSGAHALASLKTQQKCQVEQGQKNRVRCIYGYFVRFVANMMLRTVLRADCSRFWLFLCVCVFKCSNIHCHFHGSSGAHALASLKTQQKCQVEQGQMYICIWCNSFHGSSGANAIASLKTQQKCSRN